VPENALDQRIGEKASGPTLCHEGGSADKPILHFVFADLPTIEGPASAGPSGNSPAHRPDTCPPGVLQWPPGVYPAGAPSVAATVAGTRFNAGSANTHQSLSVDR